MKVAEQVVNISMAGKKLEPPKAFQQFPTTAKTQARAGIDLVYVAPTVHMVTQEERIIGAVHQISEKNFYAVDGQGRSRLANTREDAIVLLMRHDSLARYAISPQQV